MTVQSSSFPAKEISRAADVIRNGGIVAFPTETFYGLAVDPFNPEALMRLFELKRRSSNKPVLVLIDKCARLSRVVRDTPELYEPLIDKYWPGPLTLIFDGIKGLPNLLTDHRGTIGVRWPFNRVACQLATAAGGVITGTSANPSGKDAAVSAEEVRRLFPSGIDQILDCGKTPGGLGSTIITIKDEKLFPVRKGVFPVNDIISSNPQKH